MIEGFITLYWDEDDHRQNIKFLHNLKGILYKDQRPSRYTVTTNYYEPGPFQPLEKIKIDEWLRQVPRVLKKVNI